MEKEIEDKKNNVKKIKISAVPTMCNYSLPCVIHHLKQHYPNISVELYSRSDSFTIEEELRKERCDIGFLSETVKEDSGLVSKKIFEEEIKNFINDRKEVEKIFLKINIIRDNLSTLSRKLSENDKNKIEKYYNMEDFSQNELVDIFV